MAAVSSQAQQSQSGDVNASSFASEVPRSESRDVWLTGDGETPFSLNCTPDLASLFAHAARINSNVEREFDPSSFSSRS